MRAALVPGALATVLDPPPIGSNGWNGGNLTVSITAGGTTSITGVYTALAASTGADLIVMGTHGRSGFNRWMQQIG